MKWLLAIVFLSTGVYEENHVSEEACIDAMIEASLVKPTDIWSMACFSPDDRPTATASRDIGP